MVPRSCQLLLQVRQNRRMAVSLARKCRRLRRKIAAQMVMAQHTAAILTTFNECDMSAVQELRAKSQESFTKKNSVKLGFMSFFIKATVEALKAVPVVNGRIDGDDFIQNNFYDIGVAVGTERGLVVPVVRDADKKSFADLELDIAGFAVRAREGKLKIEELQGGTFTISNGGVYGSLMGTPILNPPQSGILGMHKIMPRPVAIDGKVEVRPMMFLALSYDHRAVDGKEAVTFLVKVKECIEDPKEVADRFLGFRHRRAKSRHPVSYLEDCFGIPRLRFASVGMTSELMDKFDVVIIGSGPGRLCCRYSRRAARIENSDCREGQGTWRHLSECRLYSEQSVAHVERSFCFCEKGSGEARHRDRRRPCRSGQDAAAQRQSREDDELAACAR